MLSLVSSQNSSMTSRESTPSCRNRRPISLANETLVAWKALQANLRASATRSADHAHRAVQESEKALHGGADLGLRVPMTDNGEE